MGAAPLFNPLSCPPAITPPSPSPPARPLTPQFPHTTAATFPSSLTTTLSLNPPTPPPFHPTLPSLLPSPYAITLPPSHAFIRMPQLQFLSHYHLSFSIHPSTVTHPSLFPSLSRLPHCPSSAPSHVAGWKVSRGMEAGKRRVDCSTALVMFYVL